MTIGPNHATIGVCMTSQYHNNGGAIDRREFYGFIRASAPKNHVRNKIIYGLLWGDSPMIVSSDCTTLENYWRITPFVTTNIVFNDSPYTILYFLDMLQNTTSYVIQIVAQTYFTHLIYGTGSKQNVLTKWNDISCVADLYNDGIGIGKVWPPLTRNYNMCCLSPYHRH